MTLRGAGREQLMGLQREIELLRLLRNPYIVNYRESFSTQARSRR